MNNDNPIICNQCGKNCCKPLDNDPPGIQSNYGLNNAVFTTGYFSKCFEDLLEITFSICEECLFDLFNTFEIMPDAKEVDVMSRPRSEIRKLELVGSKYFK